MSHKKSHNIHISMTIFYLIFDIIPLSNLDKLDVKFRNTVNTVSLCLKVHVKYQIGHSKGKYLLNCRLN